MIVGRKLFTGTFRRYSPRCYWSKAGGDGKSRVVTIDTVNRHILDMQYAVRGPVEAKASEIESELKRGCQKPFKSIVRSNIGDCHATGQKPITFLRQVLALCLDPTLLDSGAYPPDAKSRANDILASCQGHSIGAYTNPAGMDVVRQHIAEYISRRDDGIPAFPEDIFLSNGATEAIRVVMKLLMTNGTYTERASVLIPVPRFPLYTAALTEYGAVPICYYLDENNNWGLSVDELERAINEARQISIPRAIAVINPGNPTGQVLSDENIREIIRFAYRERLVILADEVYQYNIYDNNSQFHSFKKILRQLEEAGEFQEKLELASFMSVSKGYMGECGLRGGYCEVVNFEPDVKAQLFKSISPSICSTAIGQAAVDVIVNPPKPNEPSYEHYVEERNCILSSLKQKSALLPDTYNSLPGISCNPVQGAMYCFPRLDLSNKAMVAAERQNLQPDEFYCYELLEKTGICVVPGSGFGQKPGSYHFRTTILPKMDTINESMHRFRQFHLDFLENFKDESNQVWSISSPFPATVIHI